MQTAMSFGLDSTLIFFKDLDMTRTGSLVAQLRTMVAGTGNTEVFHWDQV